MPSVGSRRKHTATVKWNVVLPADLAYRFEMLFMDTGKLKPIYGAKAQVIEQLLEDYVSKAEARQTEAAINAA